MIILIVQCYDSVKKLLNGYQKLNIQCMYSFVKKYTDVWKIYWCLKMIH